MRQKTEQAKKQTTRKPSAANPAKAKLPARQAAQAIATDHTTTGLLGDVRSLIDQARHRTAQAVNSTLVSLNWHIGNRIRTDILQEKRAEYGEEIVQTPSAQIDPRIRERLLRQEPAPHDEICRSLLRCRNCLDTV